MVGAGLSAVGVAVAVRFGWLPAGPAAVAVGLGAGMSLAPDFDEPGSTAPRTFGWIGRALAHVVRVVALGHRGATHTVEVAVASCLLLWWAEGRWVYVAPIFVGCALAVAVDGIPSVRSTHSLGVGLAAGWWAWSTHAGGVWLPAAALIGWLAHMACDAPTPHGIPVFLWRLLLGRPCVKVGGRKGWFTTGTGKETVVAWFATLTMIGVAVLLAGPELHRQLQFWSSGLRVAL